MSFSIKFGNFLYKHAYGFYKPLYWVFKKRQDAFEIEFLKKNIKPNAVVLDIGANIGFYAKILSGLVGKNGKVHCFEPDVQNFARLSQACSGIQNVIINNMAVGPRTETIKIYTSKNLNVDHRTYKPEEYEQEFEIQATSIDDYLGRNLKVDLIKMDIQGFEMQAIQGMQKTLETNRNIKIISEFWPYGIKKAGDSLLGYFNFLLSQDFNCYLFDKSGLTKLTSQKVSEMENLGEEHFFNIFASREHV